MDAKKNHFSLGSNLGFVLRGVAKYGRSAYALFALNTLVSSLLPFVAVLLPKVLVQGLESEGELRSLLLYALGFALAGMLFSGLSKLAYSLADFKLVYVRMDMYRDLCQKIMDVDYAHIEDPHYQDRVNLAQSAFLGNSVGVEGTMHLLFDNIPVLLSLLGMAALLSFLHPAVVLLLVVSGLVILWLNLRARRREAELQTPLATLRRQTEYLSNSSQDFAFGKDVRLYGVKDYLMQKFDAVLDARDRLERRIKAAQLPRILTEGGFTLLREGVVYGYLIYLILQGRMALSDFAMYFAAVASFSQGLQTLLGSLTQLLVELRKVDEVHAIMVEPMEDQGDVEPPKDGPIGIELEHVSFAYPGGKTVLHDLNLCIKPGEKLAIVGLNGAGKTTLVKLLTRLYEPTEGRILLNGRPAARMAKQAYFRLFSAVFQEIKVFAFTLAENIAMQPRRDLDMEKVRWAAALAGIDKKAQSLPEGYDSLMLKHLDLHGVELSGGENQRLALARALYKDGPILVLDEPTAALDPLAEYDMYQRLAQMTEGKTSIFISHRLSSTRFCDRILLLEDGRVVEEGSHEELLRRGGKYAKLFQVQAQYYKEDARNAG